MKLIRNFILLSILLGFVCCNQTPAEKAEKVAKDFGEALYNLDYDEAKKLCTSQSASIIDFLSSNISEENIDMVKKAGKANVDIVSTEISEDGTSAIVKCRITNYLKIRLLEEHSSIEKETEENLYLIKDDDSWLVELHK